MFIYLLGGVMWWHHTLPHNDNTEMGITEQSSPTGRAHEVDLGTADSATLIPQVLMVQRRHLQQLLNLVRKEVHQEVATQPSTHPLGTGRGGTG